jgi:NAD(P)-dependent dehydrogenase (short-subunit alcohol dehydrogenase family)
MREKGVDVLAVQTNVSKPEELERLAQQTLDAFGAVNVVCNNAGVAGAWGPIWANTLDDWNWIMGVNLWGVIHGVRTFLPIMLEQGQEGHVVNTASLAGLMPGRGIYGVTKQAVVALSESLFNDLKLADAKIGVSVVCPGWVNTRIMDADRNRPPELSKTVEPVPEAQRQEMDKAIRTFIESGLDPAAVAEQVFEAVRDDQLYVITHPEMDFIFRERFENIMSRTNPAARPLG